ncbi:glycosyltransferase family 4 protein [Anaerolineae bacterium CFX7]|nr:glycosyltransferase family 4 protein [Anaerolineae bacterium CFX7]
MLKILMLTSEWPTPAHPEYAPFIVRQVDYLRRTGIQIDLFHFRGAKSPVRYMQAWKTVQSKLAHNRYDLIHAQFGQSGLLAILPKSLPLVVTFRGSDLEGIVDNNGHYSLMGKVLQIIGRAVARRSDQVIVVSQSLARFLSRCDYHIIPSGLDLELFHPLGQAEARRALGINSTQPLVFFGGNPDVSIKRYGLAQAAFARVKDRFPESAMLAAKGIAHSQIPLYLNAADVLLLTSLHEGSPNVVKEALACNLPVVSTAVGDVRERLGSVEGCVVCADDSPETIAEGLTRVLTKRQRIEGRAAVQDLDEKVVTRKVIEVYHLALGRTAH